MFHFAWQDSVNRWPHAKSQNELRDIEAPQHRRYGLRNDFASITVAELVRERLHLASTRRHATREGTTSYTLFLCLANASVRSCRLNKLFPLEVGGLQPSPSYGP
jgi:hypothetical protein